MKNPPTSVTPEYTTGRSQLETDDEVRHRCRNPRCRSKLPASVSNPREAFCTRGCHNSFYRHRCLICERPIEQPIRGKRLICKKVKCRSALRSNSYLGRHHSSSAAKSISNKADFIGVKQPLKPRRPWRILAGPELSASAFHFADVGGEEAVKVINRTNLKHWRAADANSEEKTLIKRHHPPVNVLCGYKHSGAPVVDLAPSKPATSEVQQGKAHAICHRDQPLTGCWNLLGHFNFGRATGRRGEKQEAATNILFGDLLVAYRIDPECWVSYSRRKEFYAQRTRYQLGSLTYTNVMRFVEREVERGTIENQPSSPGQRGTQSRMRLLPTAAHNFEHGGARLIFSPPEIVVLRDANKQLIDYADNAQTRRIRFKLIAINDALAATELTYQGRLMRSGDISVIDGDRILVRNALYRVFNRDSFDLGGRFYGAWWQNIKSAERRYIGVNGSRSVELDHSQLHPRLLYAIAGKSIDGDAYEIEGWNRSLVKEAVNTLINADDELSAMQSIARSIGGKGAFNRVKTLIEQIKSKHPGIADCFGTGAGLRLMRLDSDMAESVQLRLIGRGIVSLPIHDSFIVEERHAGVLKEIMDEVFDQTLQRISGRRASSVPLSKKVPQYGGGKDGPGPAANDNDRGGGELGVA